MKFGFFAMPEHPPGENWTLSYDRDLSYIVLAEQLGYDEFWIGEHHTGGYENIPAPDLMIAKAAGLTSRIRLGTGVINLPYHDPYMVAARLAFLDHLTHGRLDYGFGGGGLPSDKIFFGLPSAEAKPRTDEALDIICHLLTSTEPLDWNSPFYKMSQRKLQVRPFQEVPPIAIAGLTNLDNYAKCAQRGWMPLSIYFQPVKIENNAPFHDLVAQGNAIEESAKRAGIDPRLARAKWRINREVYVSDSRDQALAEIRQHMQDSYNYLFGIGLAPIIKRDRDMPDAALTLDWIIENLPCIFGSPADCIRQIHELNEQVGGFGCLLINQRDWVTSDKWRRSLELFARHVAPQFSGRDNIAYRQTLVAQARAPR